METLEDFLAHYGVRGMKWGVRRDKVTGARPIAVTLEKSKWGQLSKANVDRHNARVSAKAAKKAGLPPKEKKSNKPSASADAVNAKNAATIAKKHGTQALSNKDLQALVTRMNLEQQYSSLASKKKKNPAAKFVTDVLVNVGKQQASKLVNDAVTKQVASMMVKTATAK